MPGLEQVFLMVSDIGDSRVFYEDVFGLEPTRVGSGSVSYEVGGVVIKLQSDFEDGVLMEYGLEPPGESRGDGCVYVLDVEESIEVFHERCMYRSGDLGGEVLTDVREVEWCSAMFLVRDPDGYVFEIR